MADHETVRRKYAETDTEELIFMWTQEARMDWAENILREELVGRGLPDDALDRVKAQRQKLYEEHKHTDVYALDFLRSMRLCAFLLTPFSYWLLRYFFNGSVGAIVAIAVLVAYLGILFTTIFRAQRIASVGLAPIRIFFLGIEGAAVIIVGLVLAWKAVFASSAGQG